MRQMRNRDSHNFEAGHRGGTFATPVRLAYASGTKAFTITIGGGLAYGNTSVALTYSSDCPEGEPNFDSSVGAPAYDISVEEDTSGGALDWTTAKVQVTPFYTTPSRTGDTFWIVAMRRDGGTGGTVKGIAHWFMRAIVTSGE